MDWQDDRGLIDDTFPELLGLYTGAHDLIEGHGDDAEVLARLAAETGCSFQYELLPTDW